MKKTQQSAPVITSLGADQEEPRSLSRHGNFSKQNLNSCGLQPPGKHQCGFCCLTEVRAHAKAALHQAKTRSQKPVLTENSFPVPKYCHSQ